MLHRLKTRTPYDEHILLVSNGYQTKNIIWWRFYFDFDNVMLLDKLIKDKEGYELRTTSYSFMENVLWLVGSHSTLWIDDYKGLIAPPDTEIPDFTFPSGKPLPQEFWWNWYPDEESTEKLLKQANHQGFLEKKGSIFKSLVPYQLQRKLEGSIAEITHIPLIRLPGMVKKDCIWMFEWED